MSKNNKPKTAENHEAMGEAIDPASLKLKTAGGIFVAATNISTGDKVYKAGEELNPEDFDNFDRLLKIGAVRVDSNGMLRMPHASGMTPNAASPEEKQ